MTMAAHEEIQYIRDRVKELSANPLAAMKQAPVVFDRLLALLERQQNEIDELKAERSN